MALGGDMSQELIPAPFGYHRQTDTINIHEPGRTLTTATNT